MTNQLTHIAAAPTPPATAQPRFRPTGEGYEEMLTKRELAAKLKVTPRTVENWQREGLLPYIKISSVVLFHWPEIVAHLNAHFKVTRRGMVRPHSGAQIVR